MAFSLAKLSTNDEILRCFLSIQQKNCININHRFFCENTIGNIYSFPVLQRLFFYTNDKRACLLASMKGTKAYLCILFDFHTFCIIFPFYPDT